MGDRRFQAFLDTLRSADDRLRALYEMSDEGVIQALAALTAGPDDPFLANVLTTEALNRLERARVVAQHLGEGVVATDEKGRVTSVNPAAERLTGHSAGWLRGRDLHEALSSLDVHGRPVPPEEGPVGRVLRSGAPAQARSDDAFTRQDGTRFPVDYTAAPVVRDGTVEGVVVVFRDRTRERADRLRMEALLEAMPVGVFLLDGKGALVQRNEAARRLWGDSPPIQGPDDYVRFRAWWSATGEPLKPHEWAAARVLAGEPAVLDDELLIETFDGRRRTILNSAVPLRGEGGGLEGVVVVNVDITERKRTEAELERRRRIHEALAQAQSDLGDGVVLSDGSRILFANDALVELTGRPREEILAGGDILALAAPEARPALEERRRRRMAGEPVPDRYETALVRKDGERVPVAVSVKMVAGEDPPLVVALVRDLRREGGPGEPRELEPMYRLLVECVKDVALFTLDAEGRVRTWTEAAARIHGHSADEAVGRHVAFLYPPDEVARGRPAQALEAARSLGRFEEEGRRVRKDGSVFRASVVLAPVHDAAGRPRGFAAFTRDLTSRVEHESLRRRHEEQADRNRELEAFTYTVSHDLRAPLRAMLHLTEFLERDHAAALGDEALRDLAAIRTSAERMARLVEDLLQLSRSTGGETRRRRVDVTRLAHDALRALREREPGRAVEVRVQEGMEAHADPALLRVVLDNLLGNAWKFTRKRPDARIEMGVEETPRGRAFFVRDNGAGFDPARAGELFAPFRRLHPVHEFEGTGVGLATVRRIVERHGGAVWAEGAPGEGATFRFTLPEE